MKTLLSTAIILVFSAGTAMAGCYGEVAHGSKQSKGEVAMQSKSESTQSTQSTTASTKSTDGEKLRVAEAVEQDRDTKE